ncbi:imidazolonepropionase [Pacificimonas flava]|uniref:Imidazolonepropionase n=1 Tax=Pacificimonas flava TaxID=1234595 RepID=M2SDF4_9SPHN|nr:imidazolonepropionase [Pacificimonas flava]EMD83375.1 Imidazolonepropionase [Pacificimonas flava]MBB5279063.1 imidazolonepropionase [Pacificimonas flava]
MAGDLILTNCCIATMAENAAPYGLIEDAVLILSGDRIAWVGPRDAAPSAEGERQDLGGRLVTPGLIDCHTHLVFGGERSAEFEARLNGQTYEQISKAGGGIASTVAATRGLSAAELARAASSRLEALLKDGVTTVEIKSGYGLDLDSEREMLRGARLLGERGDVHVRTTFLGLHTVPATYRENAGDYVDLVINDILPEIAKEGLADAVDAYVEHIAFSADDAGRFFDAARRLGLPAKLHADQLSDAGGVRLASRSGCLSADHLEYANSGDLLEMAARGIVAVLLPGAFYTLREEQAPPVEALRRHGIGMAVATDCNPGTSPLTSLLLAMNMACTMFRLTPEEALAGTTRVAARALGLEREIGVIAPDMRADLAIWNAARPAELSYWVGQSLLECRVVSGKRLRSH